MNGSTFREIATSEREHMIICIFMPRLRHILTFVCDFVLSTTASAGNPNGLFGDSREQANAGPSLDLRDGCGKGFTGGKKECGERFYRNTYSGNLDNFLRITGSTRYRLNDPK